MSDRMVTITLTVEQTCTLNDVFWEACNSLQAEPDEIKDYKALADVVREQVAPQRPSQRDSNANVR